MSNRPLTLAKDMQPMRLTARGRVVATLTKEILDNPQTNSFRIASEPQLCQRFNVSRVTIRLALGDLQNRGLIFRQQGKGTFAHARSTRRHRYLAVVLRSKHSAEDRFLSEFLRGAYSFMKSLKAGLVVSEESPREWPANLTGMLAGAIVVPENVTSEDLESLRNRNVPFLLMGETELTGPRIRVNQGTFTSEELFRSKFFKAGEIAARTLSHAAMTGEPVGNLDTFPTCFSSNLEPIPTNQRTGETF